MASNNYFSEEDERDLKVALLKGPSHLRAFAAGETPNLILTTMEQFMKEEEGLDNLEEFIKLLGNKETDSFTARSIEERKSRYSFISLNKAIKTMKSIGSIPKTKIEYLLQERSLKNFYEALDLEGSYSGNLFFDLLRVLSVSEYADFMEFIVLHLLAKKPGRDFLEMEETLGMKHLYQAYCLIKDTEDLLSKDMSYYALRSARRLQAAPYLACLLRSIEGRDSEAYLDITLQAAQELSAPNGVNFNNLHKTLEGSLNKGTKKRGYGSYLKFESLDNDDKALGSFNKVILEKFLSDSERKDLLSTLVEYADKIKGRKSKVGYISDFYQLKDFYYIASKVIEMNDLVEGSVSSHILAGVIPDEL